jgi:rRNA maturation protein Nop10
VTDVPCYEVHDIRPRFCTVCPSYTMSSELLGKAGMKLFEKHLDQYAPTDPLYEHWTDERGKKRRRVVSIPAF